MNNPNLFGFFLKFAAICVGSLCPGEACAQKPTLRWKFEAGNQYEITIDQTTALETETELVKQKIDTSSSVRFGWLVKEVDLKGLAQIEMVIQSVQIKVLMPVAGGLRTLHIDTAAVNDGKADPQQTEMLQNLQAVIGKPIQLQVTDRGEIKTVEVDEATKTAIRQAPQSMQIRQMLTEDGLRELFASGAPVLPEIELKTGESWTVTKDFANSAGKFRRDQILTWVGGETHENVAQEKIDVAATLTFLDSKPMQGQTEAAKLTLKDQKTTGTIWFDPEHGMITQGSIASSLVTASPYREKSIVTRTSSQVELRVRRAK